MDVGNSIPFPVTSPELIPSEEASKKIDDILVAIPRPQTQLLPVRSTSPVKILRQPSPNATNGKNKKSVENNARVPACRTSPARSDALMTGGERTFPIFLLMRRAPPRMDKA